MAGVWTLLVAIAVVIPTEGRGKAFPRVDDRAGILGGKTSDVLTRYLAELEQKTGAQVAVITVRSTGGVPIEQFALRIGEGYGLGKKGVDNGVVIVVAVEDREYRIEVGYGLERVLPDGLVGSIGREYFVPNFRAGRYGEGLLAGTVAVCERIAADAGVTLSGRPAGASRPRSTGGTPASPICGCFWVAIILVIVLASLGSRRRRLFGPWGGGWIVLGQPSQGWSGHSGWGGSSPGWGGGFGGGFGGGVGRGGSFGGGGASGRW